MFDVAIVGGGITGAMCAYLCTQKGLRTVLYEKDEIAAQASGAAGAFISPKIGKGGQLETLTNEAFAYAVNFYHKHFPHLFTQTGIYRIAKDSDDAQKFDLYERHITQEYENKTYQNMRAFFFPKAGVVDAQKMCRALVEGVEVVKQEVTLDMIEAKNIILATGAQQPLVGLDYIGLRKTWGLRIDAGTQAKLTHSIHKNISVSASHEGVVKIGATHAKNSDTAPISCQKDIDFLLHEAKHLTRVQDFTYRSCYCGTRSAVRDYFPIAGKVVDVEKTLDKYPAVKKGIVPRDGIIYHKDLYMIGGTGGRGFVFAPLIATSLIEYITKEQSIDKRIDPDRLFYKWARKLN